MNKEQEESLFFYARNDYLIINNLLLGNVERAIKGYKLAYEDGRGMVREALEVGVGERWGVSKEKGQEIFDWYEKRYPDELNKEVIETALKRALNDFHNILNCMSPLSEDMVLNRNISVEYALNEYKIGQKIKLKTVLSTSVNIYEESFWGPKTFLRYVLNIPKGTPAIKMWEAPEYIRNEEDEVLLPPLEVKVKTIREGYGDCQKIIELNFVALN